MAPNFIDLGLIAVGFEGHDTSGEYKNPICDLYYLVKIFADEEHRSATIARLHDLLPDLDRRRLIQAEARILDNQEIDVSRKFTCKHDALHVATRKSVEAGEGR